MMKNYHESFEINHNRNWPYIHDHTDRILINGGKTDLLLNLIKYQQPDIDQIYFYLEDPLKPKNQLLVNGREKVGIKKIKNVKAFIDYSKIN